LAYFLDIDHQTGRISRMDLVPFRLRKFRLARASRPEAAWLAGTLDRECRRFGHHIQLTADNSLTLSLPPA
jgi:poly-gamma-glutamate synthesis protein (capsule biosynthesis protein)